MIDLGLKPCPFCGRKISAASYRVEGGGVTYLNIRCDCCGTSFDISPDTFNVFDSRYCLTDAVDVWNHRVNDGTES